MIRLFLLALLALSLNAQTVPGRFILQLDEEPLAALPALKSTSTRDAQSFQLREASIQRAQTGLRNTLLSRKVKVRATLQTVANAIIVEDADPSALNNLPGVKRVYPVRLLHANLDRAIIILKLQEAWAKVGGLDKAGAGIKIGMVDTGIDPFHIGFLDKDLPTPDGYPKFSPDSNKPFTSNKIIVARSYSGTALDRNGHGTGTAMAAAGVFHEGPRGDMAGGAPKAWLGIYKASEATDGSFAIDNVLRAIDDAVLDKMDILNLSLGATAITLEEDDVLAPALNLAAQSGVVVVTAAGNDGPDLASIGDTGSASSAISVGSSDNDRIPTNPSVIIPPSTRFSAIPASNSEFAPVVQGVMVDVITLDRTGLGCNPFPPNSLQGKIALIDRGDCFFSDKFANAKAAGAIAAVVSNNVSNPALIAMDVAGETLPGLMVPRSAGVTLRDRTVTNPDTVYTIVFGFSIPIDPNLVSDFSGRGPTPDLRIKPDILATGSDMITATNGTIEGDPESSGYIVADGTSISAPIVAGAAAVLKQFRPSLTVENYRSLLINSATPFPKDSAKLDVQATGAGQLNLSAALSSPIAANPSTLSFREYRNQSNWTVETTITNLAVAADPFDLKIVSTDSLKPEISHTRLALGPGESQRITLTWNSPNPPPGPYQGFLEISSASGSTARLPYWMAVRNSEAKAVTILDIPVRGNPGGVVQILFRVTEDSGLSLIDATPEITVVSGSGSILQNTTAGSIYPGVLLARLRLGLEAGINEFKIKSGKAERTIRIRGGN